MWLKIRRMDAQTPAPNDTQTDIHNVKKNAKLNPSHKGKLGKWGRRVL